MASVAPGGTAGGIKLRLIIKREIKQDPGPVEKSSRDDAAAGFTGADQPLNMESTASQPAPLPSPAREQQARQLAPGRPGGSEVEPQEQQQGAQAPLATESAGPGLQSRFFMLVLGRLRTAGLPPDRVQVSPAHRHRRLAGLHTPCCAVPAP